MNRSTSALKLRKHANINPLTTVASNCEMRRNYGWSRKRILWENDLLEFHSTWAMSQNIPPFLVNIWYGVRFRISVIATRGSRLYIRRDIKTDFLEKQKWVRRGRWWNSSGSGYGQIPRHFGQGIEPSGWSLHRISPEIVTNSTIPYVVTQKIVFQGGIVK